MRTLIEARDRAAIRNLQRNLEVLDAASRSPLDGVLPQLREALDAEKIVVYRVRADHDAWALEFAVTAGLRDHETKLFADGLHAAVQSLDRFGFYDPSRVEPGQQNKAISFESARRVSTTTLPRTIEALSLALPERERRIEGIRLFARFFAQWGLDDHAQLRALICDGPALLAWVGGLRATSFDARATRVLEALVPPLQRRLRIEARLGHLGVALDPLSQAVLEYVAGAAFIVDARGAVVIANSAAKSMLADSPREVLALMRPSARPGPEMTRTSVDLAARGLGALRLVILQDAALRADHAARGVAVRHALTPRETQVLALLARGSSNLSIARTLRCAERTVEVHVGRILLKLDCATRAEAIARTLA